jgi:hypothetical protein
MKLLALDIATKTGFSVFEGFELKDFGIITADYNFKTEEYPKNFTNAIDCLAHSIYTKVVEISPDLIVIEEINKTGRFGSRHSQKLLDGIHHCFLSKAINDGFQVKFINTSDWRKTLGLSVSETKKKAKPLLKELLNLRSEFSKADKQSKKEKKMKLDLQKEKLKKMGLFFKIDKKSIALNYVNINFNLNLNKSQDDIADAICQGQAFLKGCKHLTNEDVFG